jgi:hypothetical protein
VQIWESAESWRLGEGQNSALLQKGMLILINDPVFSIFDKSQDFGRYGNDMV